MKLAIGVDTVPIIGARFSCRTSARDTFQYLAINCFFVFFLMFASRLCFFLSCLPCVFVFLPMPPKLRAEDEDSSSDTESELGTGPSSVEIPQ